MDSEEKQALGERACEKAIRYELDYGCCPQCVLATVQETVGGVACQDLQRQFTGRTYDMWNAEEYQAFDTARGQQCARATGTVTKWAVEML